MTITADATDYSRFSTEHLEAVLADPNASRGALNATPHLLKLDTPERRFRAAWEANRLMNLVGGRYSDQVDAAVQSLLRMIHAGEEDQETYGERAGREERERQAALRVVREAH